MGDSSGGSGEISIEGAVEAVGGLRGIAHLPFGYLSAGQRRRMGDGQSSLVAHWPIRILDEPTAALDARRRP